MKALAGAAIAVATYLGALTGAHAAGCAVAAHLVNADAGLPKVAAAISKTKSLTIFVTGTTSSTLPGANGAQLAYPARLEAALQKKLPGVTIKVVVSAKPRRTAAEMAEDFPRVLEADAPALIIWQTGTADAMKGIDPEEFRATIEEGAEGAKTGGADLILMNMQYSPRTDTLIAAAPYNDALRFVALQHGLNLFDRLGIMRHWSELGTFDLYAATKSLDTAGQVHDCIGRLLAQLVVEGAKVAEAESKETR
jgi:hypothetical protein